MNVTMTTKRVQHHDTKNFTGIITTIHIYLSDGEEWEQKLATKYLKSNRSVKISKAKQAKLSHGFHM